MRILDSAYSLYLVIDGNCCLGRVKYTTAILIFYINICVQKVNINVSSVVNSKTFQISRCINSKLVLKLLQFTPIS